MLSVVQVDVEDRNIPQKTPGINSDRPNSWLTPLGLALVELSGVGNRPML